MNGGRAKDVLLEEMTLAEKKPSEPCSCGPVVAPAGDCATIEAGTDRQSGSWSRFFGTNSGTHALALMDQAVVSGTSFLATILIGRWCGASELGVYALGFSLLVSWGCVHQSLIALPYTIYRHRTRSSTQQEYAGSALIHNGMLSAVAILVLAISSVFLSWGGTMVGLPAVLGALAGVMPFALLREFSRRFAFAHLRMVQALMLDLAVAAVQLLGLAWLASTGALTASTAYLAFGAGCAVTGAVWLYLDRSSFVIHWRKAWPTLQQSWSLGKWLFASQVTVWVQAYFIHWLLACVVGPAATGVYAACMTVVMFSNPLLLGISNALAPRAAQAFVEGGGPKLRRVIFQSTLLLGTAMALFCAVVLFAGEDIMGVVYHGSQYEGHGKTVTVLALAMLASALGMPASNGLAAAERPDLTFRAGLLAVVLSIMLVPCLVMQWGVGGASYGFLAGTVVGSLGRWAAFLTLLRRRGGEGAPDLRETVPARAHSSLSPGEGQEAGTPEWAEAATPTMDSDARFVSVNRVLQAFTQSTESVPWVIEHLDEGVQASIFVVRRRDGQPLWQKHENVVVKLYKPLSRSMLSPGENRERCVRGQQPVCDVARQQFAALSQFDAALNGRVIQGWKIQSAVPLHLCEHPLALVMTLVPGRSLNSLLETADAVPTQTLESIADALVVAMERYWWPPRTSHFHGEGEPGRVNGIHSSLHGDLNFDNILCDVATNTLSFIDPGVIAKAVLCEGVTRHWYPASRDLAYLLFDTTVSLKKTIGNPAARRRQQELLENVLRAFLKRIVPAGARESLLDEVQACARVQLQRLHASWSPRGLWRSFLRRTAARRIDLLIGSLRAEASVSNEHVESA